VDPGGVLHDDEVGGGDGVYAELDGRSIAVGEELGPEAPVRPRAGDEPRAVGRGARVPVGDVIPDLGLRHHALPDQDRHQPAASGLVAPPETASCS
jgi:hypothetical protein